MTRLAEEQCLLVEQLEFTEQQLVWLRLAREVGRSDLAPAAAAVDREARYPAEGVSGLRASGLLGLAVPAAFGGGDGGIGGDVLLLPVVLMELAAHCSSTAQVFALHNTGVQFVKAMGTPEQQQFFFREVLDGNLFASFASEDQPSRQALASTLRKVEQGYLLNGRKIFATGSPGAKWAFWRAVTEGQAGERAAQTLLPIVELSAPGVTVLGDWDGIGQRGTGSGTALAEQVFIPESQLIGSPETIARCGTFFATQFHVHFAAQYVGIATGAFREALDYVHAMARPWSGGTAAEEPYTLLRVGDLAAKLASARQLVLRAARLLHAYQTQPELAAAVQAAASHAKIIATETALDVTQTVFQVMGARSATGQYSFDRYFRNARTLTLHDAVDKQREAAGRYELARQ
ncbi:hypothetical protein EBB07_08000 [Paenibacillaceae bacterium]|nr:hypothetical protein EBB07_08000 [Paenibacillaceae bacterium]